MAEAGGGPTVVAARTVARGAAASVIEGAVRSVVLASTDLAWLSRGDSVLIKVACNSGRAYPATTDPVAVAAMSKLLREKGAGRVIVADMSGVQFVRFSRDRCVPATRKLMHANGLAAAVLAAGAEIHAFEEMGWDGFFPERPKPEGSWKGAIYLPNILNEVDHIVLMPRCSRHILAGSSLGLKAAVGWWRHDSRLEYHRDAKTFAEKTADGNTLPAIVSRQRLVVTNATKLLTSFGPDRGYVLEPDPGLVFASEDVVAHDMVSLAWLLQGRRSTPANKRCGLFTDPHGSSVAINLVNSLVVKWLGGWGQLRAVEHLSRCDVRAVGGDPVLRRARRMLGRASQIELVGLRGPRALPLREHLSGAVAGLA